jgi:hypothetical protein
MKTRVIMAFLFVFTLFPLSYSNANTFTLGDCYSSIEATNTFIDGLTLTADERTTIDSRMGKIIAACESGKLDEAKAYLTSIGAELEILAKHIDSEACKTQADAIAERLEELNIAVKERDHYTLVIRSVYELCDSDNTNAAYNAMDEIVTLIAPALSAPPE